jgi:signal transduction histidine kinase/DNA-binding response OmpR family regulator
MNGARGILRFKDKLFINAEYTYEYEPKTKQFKRLEEEVVGLAIDLDQNGDLWTGNYERFYRCSAASGKIQKYNTSIRELWSIWADTATGVWLGGKGLEWFNPVTKTIENIDFQGFPEIQSAMIYHFQPLTATKVWLATSLGLYELNPKTRKITARYWSGGKGKYQLPLDDFHHLYLEKDKKTVWLATGGKGFLRWKPQSGGTKLFSLSDNEANIVHGILPDNYGFLWLSTEKGLVQFDPKTEQLRIYTTKDGLVADEFNRISHFRDTDGTLYFGSIDGITVVRPERFKNAFLQKTKKDLFVVDVQQYIGSKRRVEERTEQWATQGKLTLAPTDRFFTLTLGVRDYSYTKDAAFFYQIKGYDKEWIIAENQRVTFGRLPYGRRTILAKALLSNGQYSEILEIPVFVKRPFYLTWWFILFVLALFVGAAYWRFNDLRQRNLFLEKEVAQRTDGIRQAKEVVEAQAEKLRTLDKMKSRFFANISHELRTPLTLITAPLQQLIAQEHSTDKRQLVQFAFNNSQRLLRLVNQILDLTKLENTELQLELQTTALLPFLRRIVAEFESFAVHKGVSFSLEFALDANAVYLLDANKVETILYNFISNALKFTPQGGEVCLVVGADETGETLLFEVKDTGRGIAAEDLPHVFERFYQSKKQLTAEGGTGIGLAICKEFATLMRGKLAAESTEGVGSNFSFRLPAHAALEASPTIAASEAFALLPIAAEQAQDPMLPFVLLVEDNLDLQAYTKLALLPHYHIHTANDGKQALAFLDAIADDDALPDLILSDIMMPEMDGWQLLQQLKMTLRYKKIPIVMLTARAGVEDKLQALRLGVDDYLTKPFLQEELKARLRNLIERGSIRRQPREAAAVEMEADVEESLDENFENADEWLVEVENYVLMNLQNPQLSVLSVAAAFGVSRYIFNRRLQLAAGMTPTDYIQEIRFNEAKHLLEMQAFATVKEVVFEVGLSNPKTFARKFFQRFGRYPSDYLAR